MNKEIMTLKLENFEKTLIIEKMEKVGQEDYKRMDKMEDIVHEQFLKKEEDHRLFDLERKSLQSQIEYLKTICHRYAMGEFMLKKESTEKDFKKESPISLYTSVADAVSHRNKWKVYSDSYLVLSIGNCLFYLQDIPPKKVTVL